MFSDNFRLNPGALNYGASNPIGSYFRNGGAKSSYGSGSSLANPQLGEEGGLATGLGFNLGTGQLVLGGLSTLGDLWNSWKMMNLAEEQFDYQKGVIDTNIKNQVKSYNTRLSGLAKNRGYLSGEDEEVTEQYIRDNKLKDRR